MKLKSFVFALVLGLGLVGSAVADTVTLGPDGCGLGKACLAIPNDAVPTATIDLYGAIGYQWFYVYITTANPDGSANTVMYKALVPSTAINTITPVELQSGHFADPTTVSSWTWDGALIYLTGSFTTYQTCVRSGRGQHCSTHWNFVGGSIVR